MKKSTRNEFIIIASMVVLAIALAWLAEELFPKPEKINANFTYFNYKENDQKYTLENSEIKFNLDPNTTCFTVEHKKNGKIWRSNPENPMDDKIALTKDKDSLRSPFLLTYCTENGVQTTYDFFEYSINRKLYDIRKEGNTIAIDYLIGNVEKTYIIPLAITASYMDPLLEHLKQGDKNLVLQYYRKIDLNKLRATDNKDQLLAKYPTLEEECMYEVRDDLKEYLKVKLEKLFNDVGYTSSDYERDSALYTGGKKKEVPMFHMTVEYSLSGSDLIVSVPFDKIVYRTEFPPVKLSVLPYFGASSTKDNGFLFVPEGGGSLIKFNNGKSKQNSYVSSMYGWDYATDRNAIVTETRNSFPVYGIAWNASEKSIASSFITILEESSPIATINADISGRYNSYNFVYASYALIHSEVYEVSDRSTNAEYVFERNLPAGEKITQRIRFIDTDDKSKMAEAYQKYLFEKNPDLKIKKQTDIPVAIEIVNAVDKVQQVLGFPTSKPLVLTTYEQTKNIMDDLKNRGFNNTYYKLTGYINGGVKQQVLKKIKPLSKLGGNSGLNKLVLFAKDNGYRLYLDGVTQFAYNNKWFDGFIAFRDSAEFASSETAEILPYSSVWYGKVLGEPVSYLVKPEYAQKMTENLSKFALKKGVNGVSLRETGYILSGNYDPHKRVSRQAVLNSQVESLKKIKNEGQGVLIQKGNEYAAPYADFIMDMDLYGNKYTILDDQIPFYQMALHGCVNYAGKPINLAKDYTQTLLESAEYGAGLCFVFMYEDETILQDTLYTTYFASQYNSWAEKAQQIYSRYNKELKNTIGKKMIGHESLTEDVKITKYIDGTKVYVNYGYTDYSDGNTVIPARDYKVLREE